MDLLHRLTKKNLQLNKKRTIVTIIGIILSVALITAVSTVFMSGYNSIINFEKITEGDFHVVVNNINQDDFEDLKNNRYVENYFYSNEVGYSKLENSKNEYKPYLYVMAFNKEGLERAGLILSEGRLPENENEILITTHLKTDARVKYNIGDVLKIDVGKRMSEGYELNQHNPYDPEIEEEIVDAKTREYKVVGIVERPSRAVEDYSAPGYSIITYTDKPSDKTNIYIRLNKKGLHDYKKAMASLMGLDYSTFLKLDNGDLTEEEAKEIEESIHTEMDANFYLVTLETGIFSEGLFKSLGTMAGVVILIIIVTSVFCIKNSFDISIAEKTKQYGMLASVGATKKQIRRNVFYEAYRLGIVGIPLGIALGLLASFILIKVSNLLLFNTSKFTVNFLIFSISIPAIIFSVILGIVTLFLSSLRSASKASKIAPIKAIRNSEDIKIKANKVKAPGIIKKIFGVGGEISYKNLKRSKKKYRTTVISIIVSVAIFISLSSLMTLLYQTIKSEYNDIDYTLSVNYRTNESENAEQKIDQIIHLNGVKDYAIVNAFGGFIIDNEEVTFTKDYEKVANTDKNKSMRVDYKYVAMAKIGEHAYNNYLKKLGLKTEDVKGKGILLNYGTTYDYEKEDMVKVEFYDVKNKQILHLSTYEYDPDKQEEYTKTLGDLEVAYVTIEKPFGLVISGEPLIILDDETYDRVVDNPVPYVEILIDADNADDLQDEVEKILEDEDYSMDNVLENVRTMRSLMLLIGIFLYGFIIVITLIGVTNIFNTITTNMELRQKEFAMLKSVGMTKKEFNRMVRLETFFYGTKALLIGLPIGIALSMILYKLLTKATSFRHYPIPYLSIIISIVGVFALIALIMKYSINKINKQNIIETIRNENI